jgi:two-component system OmpR family sensor kinase
VRRRPSSPSPAWRPSARWVWGSFFARRLAGILAEVAGSAAAARLDGSLEPSAPLDAPDEIRGVASAFQESVARMREQHRRNLLLTAGLAHELRSPIQNLVAEVEVARLRPRTGDGYTQFVSSMLDELRALALVVDNLVTLTSLRDETFRGRAEEFDLAEELGIRLTHEEREAARRGVTVDVQHDGPCRVQGDREALVLMVRNLVGNASRWTRPDSVVDVILAQQNGEVFVTVTDDGPGVPVAERERIFEPFHRGPSPDGMRDGYGLGLALARAAARCQGGDIRVGAAEGGGARFEARFPKRGG